MHPAKELYYIPTGSDKELSSPVTPFLWLIPKLNVIHQIKEIFGLSCVFGVFKSKK